ncbi:MAG: TrkH family potassium uptake protein [Planctomycetota bacterium]|jgi:trk system potassium uptake protein TrkH
MRNRYVRFNSVFYFTGNLLVVFGVILLFPVIFVLSYWSKYGDGFATLKSFLVPSVLSFAIGIFLRTFCKRSRLDTSGAMLTCAVAWLAISALGAIPFVIGIGSSYLDGYFEAMSGFTTTGITVFSGLDEMPRSILFWRALTQWVGGLGILSFFLVVVFGGGGAGGLHHVFSAESHKIASARPAPSLFRTVKILWGVYGLFTVLSMVALTLEGMTFYNSLCHSLTALSTGGFSPHDSSIAFYRLTGHPNYRLIEYTVTFMMLLGGVNFLVHYRVLRGKFRALWDNTEMRYWWGMISAFVFFIIIDHLRKTGVLGAIFRGDLTLSAGEFEKIFRNTIFQVIAILTTTGFGTEDIGSDFFGACSRQLFLVMMVIGGCVGSTGGGFKVLRIAILNKLMLRELFKLRVPSRASTPLVIDQAIVPDDESHRIAGLFFVWIGLLAIGGCITALFSHLGALESVSGMFSALGNIGPCYISVPDMIEIHWLVKITYIVGMLAGRLEIIPVLLLFSWKAWR